MTNALLSINSLVLALSIQYMIAPLVQPKCLVKSPHKIELKAESGLICVTLIHYVSQ